MNMLVRCVGAASIWVLLGAAALRAAPVLNETRKLVATDGAAGDFFGRSVGIGTDVLVVGSPDSDVTKTNQGAAYVFSAATGGQLHKLVASDAVVGAEFGYSTSVSGDVAIVGSPLWDAGTAADAGSAYVFALASGVQQFEFTNPEATPASHQFGYSVAVGGTEALVGASQGDSGAPGKYEGAAYVYDVVAGSRLFKQSASDPQSYDNYGTSVAVSGNRGLVGAPYDDDVVGDSGSVYVVNMDSATHGAELRKLRALDPATNDDFGWAVALAGNLAVVGAPGDDGSSYDRRGAVYGFDILTGSQLFKLTPGEADENEWFGKSVAVDGSLIVVGAPGDNGDRGALYVFDAATHNALYKLVASDASAGDKLGESVAVRGRTILAGAPSDDSRGAAYLFTLPAAVRIPGDTDHDGDVDALDAQTLAANWGLGSATWEMGDFDDDHQVGPNDASILAAHWGYPHAESVSAPEPSAAGTLLIGVLVGFVCGRRRPARYLPA
jgi:hypothetical protein